MAVRIRAFDCTLVGKHVCSREGVLGSNPTTPKNFTKSIRCTLVTFEECPIEETSFTVHYTVFQGYYSVIGFYELMRMFLVSLMHLLG